jgi:HEAT repeat protein
MKAARLLLLLGVIAGTPAIALAESPAGVGSGNAGAVFTPPSVLNPGRLVRLAKQQNPAARLYAARGIRQVRRAKTVRAARILIADRDVLVRRTLVESIATAPSRFWLPLLTQALGDPDPGVRTRAVLGLKQYPADQFIQASLPLLTDPSEEVRRTVREGLVGLGQEGITRLVEIEVGTSPMPEEVVAEVDGTLRHYAVSNGAALAEQLDMHDVHGTAAQRIARLLTACGRPGVNALLTEMDRGLTQAAFHARRALIEHPGAAVLPINDRLMNIDLEFTKSARITVYLDILISAGDPRALPGLERLIESVRPYLRGEAARTLGHHDSPHAVTLLLAALRDDVASVRGEAATALGRLEVKAAVMPLVRLASGDGPETIRAIRALGAIGDPGAALVLQQKLKSNSPAVRRHACEALERIGHPAAVKSLRLAKWNDPDAMVRYTAGRALGTME